MPRLPRVSPLHAVSVVCLAVFSMACSDLEDLGPAQCGNGVIEADNGEDCDSAAIASPAGTTACGAPDAPEEQRCRLLCDAESPCPTGWGCGDDAICRRGSGAFELAPGSPFEQSVLEDLRVGDFDQDGVFDLVSFFGPNVVVRYGNGDGTFPDSLTFKTDRPSGVPIVGDVDRDGATDVVSPLLSGLFVVRGVANRTLVPIPYSPFELDPSGLMDQGIEAVPLRSATSQSNDILLVGGASDFQGNGARTLLFSATDGEAPNVSNVLALNDSYQQLFRPLPVADVDGGSDSEVAIAFRDDTAVRIYSLVPAGDAQQLALVETVTFPFDEGDFITRVRFADADGDGDQDLFVLGGGLVWLAQNDGAGNFSAPFVDERFDDLVTPNLACPGLPSSPTGSRWPLAIGQIAGSATADVVTADGVFVDMGGILCQTAFRGGPRWVAAELGQFNADGTPDVAAITETSEEIEFLMGAGGGLFNRTFRATSEQPRALVVGDFDGDSLDDLGIVEFSDSDEKLSIAFGEGAGAPTSPVIMAEFPAVESFRPASFVTSETSLDGISDLVVVANDQRDRQGARSLAILSGNTERRLLSPFSLVDGGRVFAPLALALGMFDPSDDALPDIVAVAQPVSDNGPARFWLVRGLAGGQFQSDQTTSFPVGQLAESFDVSCAVWTSGDFDGDGRETLVALDGAARCPGIGQASRYLDLSFVDGGEGSELGASGGTIGGAFSAPRSLVASDVDADGFADLIVVYAGLRSDQGATTGGGIQILWGSAAGLEYQSGTVAYVSPEDIVIGAAAPLNADGDLFREIAIGTNQGVFLVDTEERAFSGGLVPVSSITLRKGHMRSADFDLDGIDDLAITNQLNVTIILGLPGKDS